MPQPLAVVIHGIIFLAVKIEIKDLKLFIRRKK
jgi:hypothetical protein